MDTGKLDRVNIVLIIAVGIFLYLSSVFSIPKAVVIFIVLAIALMAFIRFIYLTSGTRTAIILSIFLFVIPVAIYLTGIILSFVVYSFWYDGSFVN